MPATFNHPLMSAPRPGLGLLAVWCVGLAALGGCRGSTLETSTLPASAGGAAGGGGQIDPGGGPSAACLADSDCASLMTTPCSRAVCEPASQRCVVGPAPEGAACDDGDACTTASLCVGGACKAAASLECDDGDPCTEDACDLSTGCTTTVVADGAPCDDGEPCTTGDRCVGGGCLPTGNACGCSGDADCVTGGDACSGERICVDGGCRVVPGSVPVCDDGAPCTSDRCDPALGCVAEPAPDGLPCDDGDVCTIEDTCLAGVCSASGALDCSLNEARCRTSRCDPTLGCVAEPIDDAQPCDDGNACTADDRCQRGVCAGQPTCACQTAADCLASANVPICAGALVCRAGFCAVEMQDATACPQDGGPCQVTLCAAGGCQAQALADGAGCDDGSVCTWGSQCSDGLCGGAPGVLDCDDGNACTADTCLAGAGCTSLPIEDGTGCDDGVPCTTDDRCADGLCVGDAVACDDDEPCTVDACAALTGACLHPPAPDGTGCDDGEACTSGDRCVAGACAPALTLDCDDGNPCTTDTCLVAGCANTPVPDALIVLCDDGDPCTAADRCIGGVCSSTLNTCACQTDADCAASEDGDLCNGTLRCVDNACAVDPATVVTCAEDPDPCVATACQPSTGQCVSAAVDVEGAAVPCDDDNACTSGEVCQIGGSCGGGQATTCDDGVLCTADLCDPGLGCIHPPWDVADGVPCDDGNACTFGDVCGPGGCVPGIDVCQCQVDADCAPFDDGNACNGGLVCDAGACVDDGAIIDCSGVPGGPCVQAQCEPASGQCALVAVTDGAVCDAAASDPCVTGGTCLGGTCADAVPLDCDDGNPCTADGCVQGGCVNATSTVDGAPCQDGDPCTTGDTCLDGACNPGAALTCDDANPCTLDTCGPSGCVNAPDDGKPCDDGDSCTVSTLCAGGACGGGQPLDCNDDNPCTIDTCLAGACSLAPDAGAACDDGDDCTEDEVCQPDGTCGGGTDACGCTSDAECASLDDGDLCNGLFVCEAGACLFDIDTVVVCPDPGVPCQTSACVPATGACQVLSAADGAFCTDGNACTTGESCVGGACAGGQPLDCDDGNICTIDACEDDTGCASTPAPFGTPCDDGEACTAPDRCTVGVCTPGPDVCFACQTDADCAAQDQNLCDGQLVCGSDGTCEDDGAPVVCPDGSPCQLSTCAPQTGACVPTNVNGVACDDGNACTSGDQCASGACVGGGAVDCDDNNPCTDDACTPDSGCENGPNFQPCDDGNPCTQGDVCDANGVCASGANGCECETDADCAADDNGDVCDGTLICQANSCVVDPATVITCDPGLAGVCEITLCDPQTGACSVAPQVDGAACNDGDACTSGDACASGACTGTPVDCDDGNGCTTNACDPGQGCVTTANAGAPCDDGNDCTAPDQCDGAGGCVPGANTCECVDIADCAPLEDGDACNGTLICAANQCVVDPATVVSCGAGDVCNDVACEPATGQCLTTPKADGTTCGGAVLCGGVGLCQAGVCEGAQACPEDGDPCTEAACDGANACSQQPNDGATCEDGNACTTGDTCSGGSCIPGANACGCNTDADCAAFDDGNLCNGVFRCIAGSCANDPATVVSCGDAADPCLLTACDPNTGACVEKPAANGAPCPDDDACTIDEQCFDGQCLKAALDCGDGNECTQDVCDPVTGCSNPNDNGTICDAPCQTFATCTNGACVCPCINTPFGSFGCQDGNACEGEFECVGGVFQQGDCALVPGTKLECPDGDADSCVLTFCNPGAAACQQANAPLGASCSDGSRCTAGDSCNGGGSCLGAPIACNDGLACTFEACEPAIGCAVNPIDVACNDNTACTQDVCDPVVGCVYSGITSGIPCDDADPCTEGETCQLGPSGAKCQGGAPVVCDDGDPCTLDQCSPASGCTFTPSGLPGCG